MGFEECDGANGKTGRLVDAITKELPTGLLQDYGNYG